MKRGRPIEDLYCRWNCDGVAEEGEDHSCVNRLAADEQVVAPDQKTKHGNRDTRERNKFVAVDLLPRKRGHEFADDAHTGEDHDVNGRVRIEPKEVLE